MTTAEKQFQGMVVYNLPDPRLEDIGYFTDSEFGEEELGELKKKGVEVVFYWYSTGNDEGAGQVLFLRRGKWYLHDAGHCSCYGPLDQLYDCGEGYSSLGEIESVLSQEYLGEVKHLIKTALHKGYT